MTKYEIDPYEKSFPCWLISRLQRIRNQYQIYRIISDKIMEPEEIK